MNYTKEETTEHVTSGIYQQDTKAEQNKIPLLLPDFITDTKSVSLATIIAIFQRHLLSKC
jgi:hypothetical protein